MLSRCRGSSLLTFPGRLVSAGGTPGLAPDVTVAEVALLARAMTYKFAVLGDRVGGAKAGVVGDPADRLDRAGRMARYCAEIRPLTDAAGSSPGRTWGRPSRTSRRCVSTAPRRRPSARS